MKLRISGEPAGLPVNLRDEIVVDTAEGFSIKPDGVLTEVYAPHDDIEVKSNTMKVEVICE